MSQSEKPHLETIGNGTTDTTTADANSSSSEDGNTISRWRFGPVHLFEALSVIALFAIALAVRLWDITTVPETITADELDNLQSAFWVQAGSGDGLFSFDWKPAPIFSLYPLVWSMEIFGDSVMAFKMFSITMSLITIAGFYIASRMVVGVAATAIGTLLLGTNLIFLHFSRTAWENMNAALFAVGACVCVQLAMKATQRRNWIIWWVATGVFCALGLYGYFTGRLIPISVALAALSGVVAGVTTWRKALGGLLIAAIVSALLFAPMAHEIANSWDVFNRRTKVVSIFSVDEVHRYEDMSEPWDVAKVNTVRAFDGLILQDGSEMMRGLWARYNPEARAPLGSITKYGLWVGLILGTIRWRKTWAWWPFFIPVFVAQIFSVGTPDMARGVMIFPFLMLYIAFGVDEVIKAIEPKRSRLALAAVALIAASFISWQNVNGYRQWQAIEGAQHVRLPGIAHCEWDLWRDSAKAAAAARIHVDPAKFDADRRELACSDLINNWLPPLPD